MTIVRPAPKQSLARPQNRAGAATLRCIHFRSDVVRATLFALSRTDLTARQHQEPEWDPV
jgi:hypothetical protein